MKKVIQNTALAAIFTIASLSNVSASVTLDTFLTFGNTDGVEADKVSKALTTVDLANVATLVADTATLRDELDGSTAIDASTATGNIRLKVRNPVVAGPGQNLEGNIDTIIVDKLGALGGTSDIEARLLNFVTRLKAGVVGEVDSVGAGNNTLWNNRVAIAALDPIAGNAGGALEAFLAAVGY